MVKGPEWEWPEAEYLERRKIVRSGSPEVRYELALVGPAKELERILEKHVLPALEEALKQPKGTEGCGGCGDKKG